MNINVKYWVKSYPDSIKANTGGCEVGRTHFCSFSISHKPTQSSWRHQMSGTLPSFLISHHDSANASSQQTHSNAGNSGSAFFLSLSLMFLFLPLYKHRCSCSKSHPMRCNLGHFTVHERSCLHKRNNIVLRTSGCAYRKVFSSLAQLLNALRQPQVQWQVLNAKDKIQRDTACGLREMVWITRIHGKTDENISVTWFWRTVPPTQTQAPRKGYKQWQLCSFSENKIASTQANPLPYSENVNCLVKLSLIYFTEARYLAVNKGFLFFLPSLMCTMKLFFFFKRTSAAVLHNNFHNYIRASSVNNLLLKTRTVALSITISQQEPTSISIFKSLLSANCHFAYLGPDHPF